MSRSEFEIAKNLSDFGLITEDKVEQFEHLLTEASDGLSISMILPLLLTLDDKCEFDEVMFGVVHAVERYPAESYFAVLVKNISAIWNNSPRWCEILHTRIINSPSSFTHFINAFLLMDSDIKALETHILKKISGKEKFTDRCMTGIHSLANKIPMQSAST